MPYHWFTVKNTYNLAPDNWKKDDIAIVSDLAWFVIGRNDTPEQLRSLVDNANDGEEAWREPYSNENCQFKTWYDQILVSDVSLGHRDSLLRTLLNGDLINLTENQACFVVHLLPCDIIRGFVQHTNNEIESYLAQLDQEFPLSVQDYQQLIIDAHSSDDESYLNGMSDTEDCDDMTEQSISVAQYLDDDDGYSHLPQPEDNDYSDMPELEDGGDYSSDDESDDESNEESDDESDDETDCETDCETDVDNDKEDVEYENDIDDVMDQFLRGVLTQQELRDYNSIRRASRDRTASRPTHIRV